MKDYQLSLTRLFNDWATERPEQMITMAQAGSDRRYFRLTSESKTAIGTYNADKKENRAFLKFSKHFHKKGIAVPEIYAHDANEMIYLQEDLGDTTLFSLLPQGGQEWTPQLIDLYKKSIAELARMQIIGGDGLDYSVCYPRDAFDKQSMLWDLNYFKHYFLKLAKIPFDEQLLEDDFQKFADYLLLADRDYFLFRDFQSRNIMIKDGKPYFVDYQGGRRGALQYDVASLLYQAKGNVPHEVKQEVLDHYMDTVEGLLGTLDRRFFSEQFYGYVLIRCLQALGAYGFRGLYERRDHFLTSIPFAIDQIEQLLKFIKLPVKLPELWNCLKLMVESDQFDGFDKKKYSTASLQVKINSFSYLQTGYPPDPSTNGGGFVFDCRFIENPGRYTEYKQLTGRDQPVIDFLKQRAEMEAFLQNVYAIVDGAVENYLQRDFASLMINFGCTGGQHRSVYAAENLTRHLVDKYGVKIELHHIEQEKKNPNFGR
jgi:aminoglycoside/choline kinase family phosphotransferase